MRVNRVATVGEWKALEERLAAGHRRWHAGDLDGAYREWHAVALGRWAECRRTGLDLLGTRALSIRFVESIGHFIYLDAYLKLVQLGVIQARNVCLAIEPGQRVSNRALLALFAPHLTVREAGPQGFAPEVRAALGWLREELDYVRLDDSRGLSIYDAAVLADRAWAGAGRPPLVRPSAELEEFGAAFLRRHGVAGPFVALHVRSAGYNGPSTRDGRLEDFVPLVRRLTGQGLAVVRLGDPSMPPAPALPGLLDYAHLQDRDPRVDVHLLSAARFFVASASGPGHVAALFGVPTLFLNWVPLRCVPVQARSWYLPKRYVNSGDGTTVSLREVLARGLGTVEFVSALAAEGLEVVEPTPDELEEALATFQAHAVEGGPLPAEDAALQARYAEVARAAGVVGAGVVVPAFARRYPAAW